MRGGQAGGLGAPLLQPQPPQGPAPAPTKAGSPQPPPVQVQPAALAPLAVGGGLADRRVQRTMGPLPKHGTTQRSQVRMVPGGKLWPVQPPSAPPPAPPPAPSLVPFPATQLPVPPQPPRPAPSSALLRPQQPILQKTHSIDHVTSKEALLRAQACRQPHEPPPQLERQQQELQLRQQQQQQLELEVLGLEAGLQERCSQILGTPGLRQHSEAEVAAQMQACLSGPRREQGAAVQEELQQLQQNVQELDAQQRQRRQWQRQQAVQQLEPPPQPPQPRDGPQGSAPTPPEPPLSAESAYKLEELLFQRALGQLQQQQPQQQRGVHASACASLAAALQVASPTQVEAQLRVWVRQV